MDSLRYLRKIVCDNSIHLVVLLEPMLDVNQLVDVKRFLHFDKATAFVQGKIWFLWEDEVGIEFTKHTKQLVHTIATFSSSLRCQGCM